MRGIAVASRYAFAPNDHGYCGSASFRSSLEGYLSGDVGGKKMEEEIRRFDVHHAYLRLIARESGMSPFDDDVVRAFWTGNRLLEDVRPAALARFIRKDLFGGKNAARAQRLAAALPDGLLPHHNFNALYINFVTGRVPRSVKNFDSCCVTGAKVLSAGKAKASVLRKAISWDRGFVLAERRETIDLERSGIRLIGRVEKGDVVSVHWGLAVEKLSAKRLGNLLHYTLRNLSALKGGKD